MAVGKASLGRVAKAGAGAPRPAEEKPIAPAAETATEKKTPAKKTTPPAKKTAPSNTIVAVGEPLPVYLL